MNAVNLVVGRLRRTGTLACPLRYCRSAYGQARVPVLPNAAEKDSMDTLRYTVFEELGRDAQRGNPNWSDLRDTDPPSSELVLHFWPDRSLFRFQVRSPQPEYS